MTVGVSAAAGLVQVSLLALMMTLAVKNVRAHRTDRRGAFRIAALGFGVELIVWVLTPAHSPDPPRELYRFFTGVAFSCFFGVLFGAAYLGLEPYVRRYWPRALVAWTRLVNGRFADPLVGRDVLIGITCGLLAAAVSFLYQVAPQTAGWPSPSAGCRRWRRYRDRWRARAADLSLRLRCSTACSAPSSWRCFATASAGRGSPRWPGWWWWACSSTRRHISTPVSHAGSSHVIDRRRRLVLVRFGLLAFTTLAISATSSPPRSSRSTRHAPSARACPLRRSRFSGWPAGVTRPDTDRDRGR